MPRQSVFGLDDGRIVVDHLAVHPIQARSATPTTISELVGAVTAAGAVDATVRAAGSCWAPSEVAVADAVVFTDSLNMHLSAPYPGTDGAIPPHRLRTGGPSASWLLQAIARGGLPDGHHLIHVEAGVKVCQLLEDLEGCGLMLPTMGAGGGQSLAGILSTATHGSDLDRPPLSSWVHAVHLVASEGQEWWISKSASPIPADALGTLPDWCPDALVIRDDDVLNAARVAMGRFGVIYSVVLEVVLDYGLLSLTTPEQWQEVRLWMRPTQPGEPHEEHVRVPYVHDQATGAPTAYVGPTLSNGASIGAAAGLTTLGIDYAEIARHVVVDNTPVGSDNKPAYNFNFVLSLMNPGETTCWVERRWQCPLPAISDIVLSVPPVPPEPRVPPVPTVPFLAPDPLLTAMRDHSRDPIAFLPDFVASFKSELTAAIQDKLPEIIVGDMAEFIGLGLGWHYLSVDMPAVFARSETSMDALLVAVKRLVDGGAIDTDTLPQGVPHGAREDIREQAKTTGKSRVFKAVASEVGGVVGDKFVPKLSLGKASVATDSHDYTKKDDPPGFVQDASRQIPIYDYRRGAVESGRSCEFHFDASTEDYLFFIDDVMTMAKATNIPGVIGVRFVPRAEALLAMQIYDLTASVEIQLGRNRRDESDGGPSLDFTPGLIQQIMELGYKRGGIAHWGLDHIPDPATTAKAFGERLELWKKCLRTVAGSGKDSFRTPYSLSAGIEPAAEAHAVSFERATDLTSLLPGIGY